MGSGNHDLRNVGRLLAFCAFETIQSREWKTNQRKHLIRWLLVSSKLQWDPNLDGSQESTEKAAVPSSKKKTEIRKRYGSWIFQDKNTSLDFNRVADKSPNQLVLSKNSREWRPVTQSDFSHKGKKEQEGWKRTFESRNKKNFRTTDNGPCGSWRDKRESQPREINCRI